MTPVKERTKDQERIRELCQMVLSAKAQLKPHRMAEAYGRWDGNSASKPRAAELLEQFSQQWDEDLQIDLPEIFASEE